MGVHVFRGVVWFKFKTEWCEIRDPMELIGAMVLAVGSIDKMLRLGCIEFGDPRLERDIRDVVPQRWGGNNDEPEAEQRLLLLKERLLRQRGEGYFENLRDRLTAGLAASRNDRDASQ